MRVLELPFLCKEKFSHPSSDTAKCTRSWPHFARTTEDGGGLIGMPWASLVQSETSGTARQHQWKGGKPPTLTLSPDTGRVTVRPSWLWLVGILLASFRARHTGVGKYFSLEFPKTDRA
jgi:hypothetical protein